MKDFYINRWQDHKNQLKNLLEMKKNSKISETQEAQLQKLFAARDKVKKAKKDYYKAKSKSLKELAGKKRTSYQT